MKNMGVGQEVRFILWATNNMSSALFILIPLHSFPKGPDPTSQFPGYFTDLPSSARSILDSYYPISAVCTNIKSGTNNGGTSAARCIWQQMEAGSFS